MTTNKVILFFYLYICIIFKKMYKKVQNMFFLTPIIQKHSKLKDYINIQNEMFIKLCSQGTHSSNINETIYDKDTYNEVLKDSNNTLEPYWKSNILMDTLYRDDDVPVLTVMYYDIYKQGFGYIADDNKLSYKALNAMAMKYVKTFHCMDFYFDEKSLTSNNKELPLLKSVFLDDDKKEKTNTNDANETNNDDVFAKLKPKNKKRNDNDKKEKNYLKNKFIYGGKLLDFCLLKKSKKTKQNNDSDNSNMFGEVLSYKDYKNSKK